VIYRKVALVDMDSYFASVEGVKNPILKRRPLAVVGGGKNPIVLSANYLAKIHGVKTGMIYSEAKKLCKNILFVKADYPQYEFTTLKLLEIIENFFPVYKEASIDEVYIAVDVFEDGVEKLKILKDEIKLRLGLSCTIGVGPNPVIAKSACEIAKPDGFLVVDDLNEFAKQLPIKDIPGVGKKSQKVFKEIGIETLEDFLKNGGISEKLRELVLKEYTEPEFFKHVPPKSIGHSLSLDKEIKSFEELYAVFNYLLFGIYSKLIRGRYGAKNVALYIKDRFGAFSLSHNLAVHTNDFFLLSKVVEDIAKKLYRNYPISKIGISLNNLKIIDSVQCSLFWEEYQRKYEKLAAVGNGLNNTFLSGYFILKSKKII